MSRYSTCPSLIGTIPFLSFFFLNTAKKNRISTSYESKRAELVTFFWTPAIGSHQLKANRLFIGLTIAIWILVLTIFYIHELTHIARDSKLFIKILLKKLYELISYSNLKCKISIINHIFNTVMSCDFKKRSNFYFLPNQTSTLFRLELIIYNIYFMIYLF